MIYQHPALIIKNPAVLSCSVSRGRSIVALGAFSTRRPAVFFEVLVGGGALGLGFLGFGESALGFGCWCLGFRDLEGV